MSLLLQFFVILTLPSLLLFLTSPRKFSYRRPTLRPLLPLLTLTIAILLLAWPTPYIFDIIQTTPDAPNWALRNAIRIHKADIAREDPEMREIIENTQTQSTGTTSTPPTNKNTPYNELNKVEKIDRLFEKLKSEQSRKTYMLYGPNTFTQCNWCTEEFDYFTYHMPTLGQQYLIALITLGIITANIPSKAGFRNYFAWVIISSFIVEGLLLYCGEEYRNEILTLIHPLPVRRKEYGRSRESAPSEYFPPAYKTFHLARYAMFVGMLVIMMFKDSTKLAAGHENEVLEQELERMRKHTAILNGANYLQRVVASDATLRTVVHAGNAVNRDPYQKYSKNAVVQKAVQDEADRITTHSIHIPHWQARADSILASVQSVQKYSELHAKSKDV